ncbi:uncharacterized protein C8R40DRAFT_1165467 [Lentinula edodes]|uniref:uncharacterized protein n=1 Tax=Lentinula edodes TaxID=5353 RepID=UPI001E8D67DB|nr:uncharacterized protein C8R40DRAFT_1165467 [Lentinula edodes]KAH7880502.1 hypothetical protein C8R40DRAFT_1165467 [Lentinula edodes]KAJ3922990.1 hypothetical protein F5877DRAFT_74720 [Lentinula edodes]
MSGSTPTKRLQLKTSDLTDFFRGSSSGPSSTPSTGSSSEPPLPVPEVNRLSSSSASPSKKRSSRIPFIGRSRKKSIHSDADVDTSLSDATKESRASVATAGSNYRSAPEQHSTSLPHASTSQQSLKTAATSTSFGSKIAAHFVPSKGGLRLQSRKSQRSAKKSHEELSDYTSDSLVPPSLGARSPSIESNISRISRSTTPRASQAQEELRPQPTITVSRPPVDDLDNMEEYNDLFTKPRHIVKSVPIDTGSMGTYLSRSSLHNDTSPLSPTPHTISMLAHAPASSAIPTQTADDTTASSIRRKGSKVQKLSRSLAGDSDRASFSGTSVSSFSALPSRRNANSDLQQGIDIDTADESEAMSIRSAMSMPVSFRSVTALDKHRSLISSHSVRSTTKSKSSRITLPSKPPSIPLPATPSSDEISSLSQTQAFRQRAHTIASSRNSSVPERSSGSSRANSTLKQNTTTVKALGKSSSLSRDSTIQTHGTDRNSSSSSSASSTPTPTKTFPNLKMLQIDVDTASIEELRKALRYRNQQFEELSGCLLRMTETHATEKRAWEGKVAELEREGIRRDKEIQGLAWLVKNTPAHNTSSSDTKTNTSLQSGSRTPSLLEMEKERSDDSSVRSSIPTPSSSVRLPINRLLQSEDSESYPTSTSEWGSGTSGAEDETQMATIRPKRTMRKLKLVESVNKSLPAARLMSPRQPGSGAGMDASGHAFDTSYPRKRSSASSSFTVASSSSISPNQSPTSITFPPLQILNPIPESRLVSDSKESHVTFSLDKEDHKRERKLSKSSFKPTGQPSTFSKSTLSSSIPSVTPGSRLTPSEAYIRNLKKGRPPSIAQILDQNEEADQSTTGNIEESYGGRSRALLAGIDPVKK